MYRATWKDYLFGSSRPGHLFASGCVGLGVCVYGIATGSPWWAMVGAVVPLWEWACTPDVDLAENRNRSRGSFFWRLVCSFWYPYGELTPHRSRFSHSLLIGTPLRLLYTMIPIILLAALHEPTLEAVGNHLDVLATAAIIGDTTHLLRDDYLRKYGLGGMLWGR